MKRIEEIDIAKGIAIIMVVLGHSYAAWNGLTQLICSFHMPFFFITSGILYRNQYEMNGGLSFRYKDKAKSLLLPWIIWGGTFQFFLSLLRVIGGQSISEQITIFITEFFKLGFGSVWFLPALYIASAILLSTVKNRWFSIFLTVVCLIVGLYVQDYGGIDNTILRAILACGFMGVGFWSASIFMSKPTTVKLVIGIMVFAVIVCQNGFASMYAREFDNPTGFLMTGILGTYILLKLCKCFRNYEDCDSIILSYLKMCGRKSMIILCLHCFLIEAIRLIDYKLFDDWLMSLGIFEGFVLTIVVMFALTVTMPTIEKILGRTFGMRARDDNGRTSSKYNHTVL